VEQHSVWRWHLETTPFDAFEYSWEISQKDVRSFGFSVGKKADKQQEEGNLSQLIEAGQGSIWEPTSSGGGRLVGSIGVTAARDGSAVELILLEQPIVKELFENRPPTLEVVARTLDTAKHDRPGVPIYSVAEQRYSIDVNYRDR